MDKPNVSLSDLLQIIGEKEVMILTLQFEIKKLKAELEKNGRPDSDPAL